MRFGGGLGKQRPSRGRRARALQGQGRRGTSDGTVLPDGLTSRLQKTGPGETGRRLEKSLWLKMSRLFTPWAGGGSASLQQLNSRAGDGGERPVSVGRMTWAPRTGWVFVGVLLVPPAVATAEACQWVGWWAGGLGRREAPGALSAGAVLCAPTPSPRGDS